MYQLLKMTIHRAVQIIGRINQMEMEETGSTQTTLRRNGFVIQWEDCLLKTIHNFTWISSIASTLKMELSIRRPQAQLWNNPQDLLKLRPDKAIKEVYGRHSIWTQKHFSFLYAWLGFSHSFSTTN